MKKTILFVACCIGLMLFASCKKEVQPTINVATGTNFAGPNTEVFSGDLITVGFNATGENLTKIELSVSQNGTALYSDEQNIDNEASYPYTHSFAIDAIGTVTIRGTVTDAKGHTATTSFEILYNEKPNAKFVGHYEGNALFTGTMAIFGQQFDVTDEPLPTKLDIMPGENNDEVTATIVFNEQTTEAKGKVENDKVTFEAFNSTYTYNGISIEVTFSITGTLNNNQLLLEGSCNSEGGFMSLEGIIGGSLEKTR